MTYREMLELYKKGTLPEELRIKVEKDVERQDAISEYLFEREEADVPGGGKKFTESSLGEGESISLPDGWKKEVDGGGIDFAKNESDEAEQFVRMVNRSVRRAFIKMGAVVGAVVLVLVLLVQFVLPDVVAKFYYNPGEKISDDVNQISRDLAVYTELTIPCFDRNNVSVYDRGYGNYDICIYQNLSLNGKFTNVAGTVEKGRMTLFDANALKRPTGNAFAWFQMPVAEGNSLEEIDWSNRKFWAAGDAEQAREGIENLPEHTKYVAYVTLNEVMDYEEFVAYEKQLFEKNGVGGIWCAVITNESGEGERGCFSADNLGFIFSPMQSTWMEWDRETYPNLFLGDEKLSDDGVWRNEEEDFSDETYMRTHFVSQLKYMAAQKDFLAMMNEEPDVYREAAEYVEENGIRVYGFAAVAEKEEMLKLFDEEGIYGVYAQELR